MNRIKILDPAVAMKIAAGEVIERPASAVRELLDNSLDADADWISIHIEKGGREFLSVRDNGKGITPEDISIAYKNHATSKISSFEDLESLKTFGFRGEALASLAEISKLTIASRTVGSDFGSELTISFGQESTIVPKGMNLGTEITATNFFENVPARLKFLGTDAGEYRAIVQEFLKKALARPDVSFELNHNGDNKYLLHESLELLDRIVNLFPELSDVLQPFSYQEHGIHVYGFLSHPSWYKSTRMYQYFFVNGRAIEWIPFKQQISIAYSNLLPPSKFSAVFCYLEIDPHQIDFNVHPQKREIRFENEKIISDIVRRGIRLGVEKAPMQSLNHSRSLEMPTGNLMYSQKDQMPEKYLYTPNRSNQEPLSKKDGSHNYHNVYQNVERSLSSKKIQTLQLQHLFEKKETSQSMADILINARYIGTCFHTYLLFEYADRLYLVDFHAMHERIRYEHILNHKDKHLDSQMILPIVFDITKHHADRFEQIESYLNLFGFQIHRISDTSFSVEAIPTLIEYSNADDVLRELFSEDLTVKPWDSICKMMACKGAVKAGDTLTLEEIQDLLKQWKQSQDPTSCPHGRPIVISLDKGFFDKEFKRTGF